MRYSLKEGVIFGIIIAVMALLIRAFDGGPLLSQSAALVLVAVVLAVAQFVVSMRRVRRDDRTAPPPRPEHARATRRAQPQDPFAQEKNQAWTGLSSTTVQEHEQREAAGAATSEAPASEAPQRAAEPSHDHELPANHH